MMSGLEPGFALAVASVTFQIVGGCIKGFETLCNIRGADKGIDPAELVLRLEENRFLSWSKRSGISDDQLDKRIERDLVNRTLTRIQTLLTSAQEMSATYGLAPVGTNIPYGSAVPDQEQRHAGTSKLRLLLRGKLRAAVDVQRLAGRCTWVICDRDKFEQWTAEIRSLNDALYAATRDAMQSEIRDELRLLSLGMVNLASTVEDVRGLQKVMRDRAENDNDDDDACSCACIKSLRLELEEYLDGISRQYTGNTAAPPTIPKALMSMPPLRPRLLADVEGSGNTTRCFAKYNGSPVYIEWRSVAPNLIENHGLQLETQAAALAALMAAPKSASFRCLPCLGYFEVLSPHRFCFLYDLPPGVKSHPARQATSLLELFYKAELKPSLSSRIRLATSLATTMLQLHSAGWLHKGFRSDNIVFFHSQGDVTSLDLDSPFVMGYEHSRLDSSNAISEIPSVNPEEDMYRHPLAHPAAGSPFRKGFDVYALGLVLLELAKWKPLRHIAKKSVNRSQITQQDLERLRQDLCGERLTDAIVDVEFRAGTVYADVVYHCLAKTCIFKGPGAQVPEEFYESFVSNVIRPLMCCKV